MHASRIPAHDRSNPDGMSVWFAEMSRLGLLFHPEDAPQSIIRLSDGTPTFTDAECNELHGILQDMFDRHGDGVIEACYPIFMRAGGRESALDS